MALSNAEVIQWMRRFGGDYDKIARALVRAIRAYIAAGMAVYPAVDAAFADLGYAGRVENSIVKGVLAILGKTAAITLDPKSAREFWLNRSWQGFGQTLRTTVRAPLVQKTVAQLISSSMRDADTWRQAAKSLTDDALITGNVAEHIQELDRLARRMLGGDSAAYEEYRKALAVSEREIERLALNDAPTRRLRAAYENVIAATEKKSAAALDAAMDRAVDAKARYNAERIARTEMSKAYGDGMKDRFLRDEDIVGFRSVLSSRHGAEDICDFYAEADLYGMGPGVFPKSESPEYPYHPHCLCLLQPVYRLADDAHPEQLDPGAGREYLDSLDAEERRALLGVDGSKLFADEPDKWRTVLRGYDSPTPARLLPDEIIR